MCIQSFFNANVNKMYIKHLNTQLYQFFPHYAVQINRCNSDCSNSDIRYRLDISPKKYQTSSKTSNIYNTLIKISTFCFSNSALDLSVVFFTLEHSW